MHVPMLECLQPAVGCFALELEQDIAALEAEAVGCVGTVDWEAPAGDDVFGSCATGIGKTYSIDVDSCGRDQAASDSESDEEWELPAVGEVPVIVPAATRIARRRGKPVRHGAWQGCCKSAWCDREDRHRGLCNHKATVPGPVVSSPHSEDACSTDNQEAECCAHPAQQELSSGGHSHNCRKSLEAADGDEREVASAFKSGCAIQQPHSTQEASMPFSCLPQLQQQPQQQQLPLTPLQQQQQQAVPVWGGGSGSRLAAAEQQEQEQQLFAMPAMYQARVKDLEAADISSMLSGEEALCSLEAEATNITVPVVQPVEIQGATVESSCHTATRHALSSPSSPSCVSAAGRTESGAFSRPTVTLLLPPTLAPAAAVVAVPSACMRGMLPLEQVHPTVSSNANTKRAVPRLAAAAGSTTAADAEPALKRVKPATVEALLRRCSSSGSSCANDAAAAAAALAAAAPSPASVMKAVADSAHKLSAAKASMLPKAPKPAAGTDAAATGGPATGPPAAVAGGAAAAAAEPKLPPLMARAQRIKQRPRRPDDPPRPLLDLSSSSSPSKMSFCNKKRPAARMAPAPTTGHSCSQCGATSTPVWRAGPAGPKTLCNACGVRYMKTAKRK